MTVIKDYISEGGAHIKVNDASMYTSQEEVEQAYRNLSQIVTRILLNNQRKKEIETKKEETGEEHQKKGIWELQDAEQKVEIATGQ